ncbi:MAG: nucleotide exchange factor GrpE [Chlamydiales bacterium]
MTENNIHEEELHQEVNQKTQPREATEEDVIPKEAPETSIHAIELESLRKQVDELRDFKDKYYRLLAEQENMRKRLQKARDEDTQYLTQSVIAEFLHPIDHFETALYYSEQMSEEVKNWGKGFEMILNQFKEALQSKGVTTVEATPGQPFDPNLHEAVEMIETKEFSPGCIVQVTMRGYRMGNRTIRPARVTVAKEKNDSQKENNKES